MYLTKKSGNNGKFAVPLLQRTGRVDLPARDGEWELVCHCTESQTHSCANLPFLSHFKESFLTFTLVKIQNRKIENGQRNEEGEKENRFYQILTVSQNEDIFWFGQHVEHPLTFLRLLLWTMLSHRRHNVKVSSSWSYSLPALLSIKRNHIVWEWCVCTAWRRLSN